MEILLILLMQFFFIFLLLGIAAYVLEAVVYMNLAKKAGIKEAWTAWIPFGTLYLSVKMAGASLLTLIVPTAFVIFAGAEGYLLLIISVAYLLWLIYIDGRMLESFGKSKNLAMFHLLPVFGSLVVFINLMIIAFDSKKKPTYYDVPYKEENERA